MRTRGAKNVCAAVGLCIAAAMGAGGCAGPLVTRGGMDRARDRAGAGIRTEAEQAWRERLAAAERAAQDRESRAVRAAADKARAEAGSRAAAMLARERETAQLRLQEAVRHAEQHGRELGAQAERQRAAAETEARRGAYEGRARDAVAALTNALHGVSLLGELKLNEEKAKAMPADRLLELIGMHLQSLGYRLTLLLPGEAVRRFGQYGEGKVSLSVSPAFNERFADCFAHMSLYDGMALLSRLYGFSVWVAHGEPVVWMGYATAPPEPDSSSLVDVYFNERKVVGGCPSPSAEGRL